MNPLKLTNPAALLAIGNRIQRQCAHLDVLAGRRIGDYLRIPAGIQQGDSVVRKVLQHTAFRKTLDVAVESRNSRYQSSFQG